MDEDALFAAALEKSSAADRRAFLDGACHDAGLRRRVERLLAAHQRAAGFLERGPGAVVEFTLPEQPLVADRPFAGRFKLRQKLGEGGMGEVWVADQTEPVQRRVALKVIRPGFDSARLLARFDQERQALALMDHPNIAKVLEAGVTDGRPYFVMELIKGVAVTKYCDEARLSPRQRLELFQSVCHAVQHAHQKGVIHRDLKPSNILVGIYDGRPVPKVIDFGVAKATGPRLTEQSVYTEVGALIGTLEYMSPEQAELDNHDIDTRSDVYSLGAVLYELLTGSVPFSRHAVQTVGFAETLRMIKEVDPPKPSTKLSGSGALPSVAAVRQTEPRKLTALVRGELDWIVMKCLEKDRARRYETADGLAMDLQRYLANEAVVAGPPSAGYRLRKFLRRNRGPVLAASLILLMLVGGIVGTTFGLLRAEDQRARAAAEAESAKKRLAQLEKGNEILASIFNNLDPRNEAKGNALRLLLGEQLEKAARQLEAEAVGDPVAVARLQRMLGRSLYGLGHLDQAITLLGKARATFATHLGPDHADTLGTMDNLALAYSTGGKLDLALPLHEEAVRLTTAKFGRDAPATLSCMHNLASCYRGAEKLDLALPLFEETLRLRTATLGRDEVSTLLTMNSLALAYKEAGQLDLAIPMLEEALRLARGRLDPDHARILPILNNLAIAYQSAGKLDLALPRLEEVVEFTRAKFGPDHPDTLTTVQNLAVAYARADKPDQALPLFQRVVATVEKLRYEHQHAGHFVDSLIACHEQLNQFEPAEAWRRKWLAVVKAKSGAESAAYATQLAQLGSNLLRQKKWSEAEAVLRECLAIRQRNEPDAWTTFNAESLFGAALLGAQKYAEAEPPLVHGYQGLKKKTGTNGAHKQAPPSRQRLTEALERLVQLYDAYGKPDEAAKWRQELEAVQKQ